MKQETNDVDKKSPIKKMNYWKIAFLVLVGILLGTTVFFASRVFQQRESGISESAELVKQDGNPVLTINSNKSQVNQLIDFYLTDFQKDQEVKYNFELRNEALLTGQFKVLNFPITFYLYFDPYVTEEGNVQLKAKSLSIGTLDLPTSEVLKMIKRSFKFPEWIEVNADEQIILIRLDQFRMQNGLFIKANKINLVDDEIQMSLYLPAETEDK
ncbi:YpmS family protein [Enterococcus gallinarum]|uniref:YpmS family protein n=1 Tax=Enterococcus gallinarum TaxID=1353 RepID=UPI0002F06B19|nr:YpmS family protein [Enterococcus gallinarum]WCG08916.1 YpmS family protein [Enterococcus gallinarum]